MGLIREVEIDKWYENGSVGYRMPFVKSIVLLKDDHPFREFSDKHKPVGGKRGKPQEIDFFYVVEASPYDTISARFSLWSIEGGILTHEYSLRSYLRDFCVKAEFTENYFIERDKIKKASEKFGL